MHAQVAQLEVSSALAGLQAYSQWQQALSQSAKAATSGTTAQTRIGECYASPMMQVAEATGVWTPSSGTAAESAANFTQLVQDYQMRTDIRVSQYGLFTVDALQTEMRCF